MAQVAAHVLLAADPAHHTLQAAASARGGAMRAATRLRDVPHASLVVRVELFASARAELGPLMASRRAHRGS